MNQWNRKDCRWTLSYLYMFEPAFLRQLQPELEKKSRGNHLILPNNPTVFNIKKNFNNQTFVGFLTTISIFGKSK